MGSHLVFRRVVREEKPDKITAWWQVTMMMRMMSMFSAAPGVIHHLPPWSLELAVLEAFLDRDLAWTLACLFFSSDLANFLPQESHVKGFSPAKREEEWTLCYIRTSFKDKLIRAVCTFFERQIDFSLTYGSFNISVLGKDRPLSDCSLTCVSSDVCCEMVWPTEWSHTYPALERLLACKYLPSELRHGCITGWSARA